VTLTFESVSQSLRQFMRRLYPNSAELSNTLNPPSMGAKVSDIPTPVHPVPGQGEAGQFTRTEHKESTND